MASNLAPCERIPTADLHDGAATLYVNKSAITFCSFYQSNLQSRDDGRVAAARDRDNFSVVMALKRSGDFKPLARMGTGAFMVLVFQCLCRCVGLGRLQPPRHFANRSRKNAVADRSLDRDFRAIKPYEAPPRPCTGAWCSGQPATPAVPAGVFDWGIETWVWWASVTGPVPTVRFFASPSSLVLHPTHCGSGVFHPPRCLLLPRIRLSHALKFQYRAREPSCVSRRCGIPPAASGTPSSSTAEHPSPQATVRAKRSRLAFSRATSRNRGS